MYFSAIVAIGWLYVTLLMALTQPTILSGISTFVFYGLLPTSIIVYVMLAPERKKRRKAREAAEAEMAEMTRRSNEESPPPQA